MLEFSRFQSIYRDCPCTLFINLKGNLVIETSINADTGISHVIHAGFTLTEFN